MDRMIENDFAEWFQEKQPKPIVLRGARQVGKSYIVRKVARAHQKNLIEVNLEKRSDLRPIILEKNASKFLRAIGIDSGEKIEPGLTMIFIDEIQAIPEAIALLRYIYEEHHGLHVVAAGSLLEFAFDQKEFSAPVGRIEYWYMGPMTFTEFLKAQGQKKLLATIREISIQDILKNELTIQEHNKLTELYSRYTLLGGMPEVLQIYLQNGSDNKLDRIKAGLIQVYEDDFHKYQKRVPQERLSLVYRRAPTTVGQKFVYTKVSAEERSAALSQALTLLCKAKVFYRVFHTGAAKLPLKSQIDEKFFKLLMLDVGLLQTSLGQKINFQTEINLNPLFEGAIAEQFVGQELLRTFPVYEEPNIYYWARDVGHSKAEVDYVIECNQKVIPVEVKSGAIKNLKSMQVYMLEKNIDLGLRFNSELPKFIDFKTSLSFEKNRAKKLLSLPLYMSGQARRILE